MQISDESSTIPRSTEKLSASPDTSVSLSDMATALSTGNVEIETIEDDIDREMTDDEGSKLDKINNLGTSGDESELDILDEKLDDKGFSNGASHNACLDLNSEDGWSKDFERDTPSPNLDSRRGWELRCIVLGIILVAFVVVGVFVAVLASRVKGETAIDFRFASYYGDSMVLQGAPHRAVIWGYGPKTIENNSVLVQLANAGGIYLEYETSVVSSPAGFVWKVLVGPVSHHGPFVINATLTGQDGYIIQLNDVLFGDVWVCSGHDRMHVSVAKLLNATNEDSTGDAHHDIRIFSIFPAKSDMLWYDIHVIDLPWTVTRSADRNPLRHGGPSSRFPAVCWLFGKQILSRIKRPVGLVSVMYSDSSVEEWLPAKVLESCGMSYTDSSSRIWNGMVHPLLDMQVYGLILHQGDLNGQDSLRNYSCSLVEFIRHWRAGVNERAAGAANSHHLPVGIVQLLPHSNHNPQIDSAAVRWQQTANFGYLPNPKLPATFFAVTVDLPDRNHNSSHSGQRHDIASRLVQGAMSVAYHNHVDFQGPLPTKYAARVGQSLTLYFDPVVPIQTRNSNGFEICCAKNQSRDCRYPTPSSGPSDDLEWKWVHVPISSNSSNSVMLSPVDCSWNIVGIRYAWKDYPCFLKSCAIYAASSGLPMPPYIHFELVDDGMKRSLDRELVFLT